ncbi:hypothetical protein GCM10025789_26090 [Tessaracoccus lubricantis]|uniref:Uncharacterized protein n=1 Tax=Tessaracoccus lubricantis TaxID=545543 RepID=A0ABP9FKV1_9ACTN
MEEGVPGEFRVIRGSEDVALPHRDGFAHPGRDHGHALPGPLDPRRADEDPAAHGAVGELDVSHA